MSAVTRVSRATAIAALLLLGTPLGALAHGEVAPPPTVPGVLLAWRFDPIPIIGVLVAAVAYLWAVRRVTARHPANRPARGRTVAFMAGLVAILLALVSPIEAYEGQLFSVHMVQHMLLELVAAPLLLLGAPITLTLRASSASVRRVLLAILQSRLVHVISFPVIAWVLFAAVNWGWHFSALYNVALENEPLHYVQHFTFVAAALLFWWPVIGLDPSPWRMPHPVRLFYLFLAMPQNSFLGVALMSTGEVLYPHYLSNLRTWGLSPLDDQHLGGILMWVMGDMAFLVGMALVVASWVRLEDRRTARLDARLDAAEAAAREEASMRASAEAPVRR
jgi:putative copper resistance protein D